MGKPRFCRLPGTNTAALLQFWGRKRAPSLLLRIRILKQAFSTLLQNDWCFLCSMGKQESREKMQLVKNKWYISPLPPFSAVFAGLPQFYFIFILFLMVQLCESLIFSQLNDRGSAISRLGAFWSHICSFFSLLLLRKLCPAVHLIMPSWLGYFKGTSSKGVTKSASSNCCNCGIGEVKVEC